MTTSARQSVREFRVQSDASLLKRERLLIGCGLLSPFFGIALFLLVLFNLPTSPGDHTAGWLGQVLILGGVVVSYTLLIRTSMQRALRKMVFVLTPNEIIRKRDGWPDDKIAFSEIDALYDGPKALVVETADRLRRISVSKKIPGFEVIREELAKHRAFSVQAKPPAPKLTGTTIAVRIMNILTWAALIIILYYALRPR